MASLRSTYALADYQAAVRKGSRDHAHNAFARDHVHHITSLQLIAAITFVPNPSPLTFRCNKTLTPWWIIQISIKRWTTTLESVHASYDRPADSLKGLRSRRDKPHERFIHFRSSQKLYLHHGVHMLRL